MTTTFLKLCTLSAVSMGIVSCSHASSATQPEAPVTTALTKGAGPKVLSFESDASGFNTKSFLVVSGNEAALIDTQFTPAIAQKALESFSKSDKVTLKYAIATHPNPDKFNGAIVAQANGAKFVTSDATANAMPAVHAYKKYYFVTLAKMFKENEYPKLPKVDVTFAKSETLMIGKTKVELTELGSSGVSSNQTVVYIPETKSLFVGDLVHHKAHSWLEGGIVNGKATPTIASWITVLKSLKEKYPKDTIVYGGRGETGPLAEVIDSQITYLTKADTIVQNYVSALGARKSELAAADSGKHFETLTRLFEKEWPTAQFSYLVQYGVYGLAQSK